MAASMRLSRTLRSPNTNRSAGTKVMPRRACSTAGSVVTSEPWSDTVPDIGSMNPKIAFRVVVLPAPLCPSTATISPGQTSRSTP